MSFIATRGIGYCGLACVSCSAKDCAGCKQRCDSAENCDKARCCVEHSVEGCWACGSFPCEKTSHPRVRAFIRCAKEDGVEALTRYLERNDARGIAYHRDDGLRGDYDDLESEEDILALLRTGEFPDVYVVCPRYETNELALSLVRPEDTPGLLECYSDPVTRKHADSTNCSFGFSYDTLEGMRGCIDAWIYAYETKSFIRWAIRRKPEDRPIGTIEYFVAPRDDARFSGDPRSFAVLRVDLLSSFETEPVFDEILDVVLGKIVRRMPADVIIAKAEEDDAVRMNAYAARGFTRLNRAGAPAYYMMKTL